MISLGKGVLTWDGAERRSDRYGTVYLISEGMNSLSSGPVPSIIKLPANAPASATAFGSLIAVVVETRDSTHIGDLFRAIYPRTPDIGSRIALGEGMLFYQVLDGGGLSVGLKPIDGRRVDWLNPRALYDAHEQSVELLFERLLNRSRGDVHVDNAF